MGDRRSSQVLLRGVAVWLDLATEVGRWAHLSRAMNREEEQDMATHVIFHEVDDVEHWLQSPKREQVFGPLGITARTFRDPQGSNRVGLIAEIPDMDEFQKFMQTDAAAEAMKHDGVRPETILVLEEG